MPEIPSGAALDLFSNWEYQNKKLAVIASNPSFVVSLRNARVTICLEDQLQLTCGEDGVLRFFVRGALFSSADPKDFPAESAAWSAEFEPGLQIRFVDTQTQCFVFPERKIAPP